MVHSAAGYPGLFLFGGINGEADGVLSSCVRYVGISETIAWERCRELITLVARLNTLDEKPIGEKRKKSCNRQ
jgi:hypothetical protein